MDMVLAGVSVRPLISELRLGSLPEDVELIDPFFDGAAAGWAKLTIFMPTVCRLDAGMKSVVWPFLRAICMRGG